MTKENLVFGLGGAIIGIIVGVVITNLSSAPRAGATFSQSSFGAQQQPSAPAGESETQMQGELPEGHPPVDQEALKQQLAAQEEELKKNPQDQNAIVSAANLNFDLKNYEKAMEYYTLALKKDPENVNLITDLGSCWLWLHQPLKAMEYYDKSLKIDPNHFQTLMNVGIARMSSGNRAGAAEAWERLVTLYPDHPEAQMLRDAIKKLREKEQG
jgi:tetratricopeptide (TPR) repeat protein